MSLKRILISAPFFFLTLTTGIALFAGTTAVNAYMRTEREPVVTAQTAVLLPSPVQTPTVNPPGSPPADSATEDVDTEEPTNVQVREFEWNGVYGFDSETLPKSFRDLGYMEVILYDFEKTNEKGEPGVPIPPKGYLFAGKEYKFKRIAVAGKQIAFQTETVNGVSYRFTGRYLALDYCETDGRTADISGELIKIVNGKWAASMKAELYEECGC